MVQGTASGVGKSLLATALCRILYQDGLDIAPFKAINISLNSGVTANREEIAISQIAQAQAAGVEPEANMNPFLIKPQHNQKPQVIIKGKLASPTQIAKYYTDKDGLWSVVKQSFENLAGCHEVIILEGAASPAEPSFISSDVVNLKIAKYAKSPVILVGDIDQGGVFASLEGTISILKRHDPKASQLIQGIVINKYQGEKRHLESACRELTRITGVPVLGVVPLMQNHGIADEDTWFLKDKSTTRRAIVLDLVIIRTPGLQNSPDFDPLFEEPGVQTRFVSNVIGIGDPDLIILPGTKNTISDLHWLEEAGFKKLILNHAEAGKAIIGICGGFQMLGKIIRDPHSVESNEQRVAGLGLLDTETVFAQKKVTKQTKIKISSGVAMLKGAANLDVKGFEIHMGQTTKQGVKVSFDQKGWVLGTYLHDIFKNYNFRTLILGNLAHKTGKKLTSQKTIAAKQDKYDTLADLVRSNLDMNLLYKIFNKENHA